MALFKLYKARPVANRFGQEFWLHIEEQCLPVALTITVHSVEQKMPC